MIPGGGLSCTGLTPGSTATYICNKGYKLNGSEKLVCQDDGTWDGMIPTCVEGECSDTTVHLCEHLSSTLESRGGLSTGSIVSIVIGELVFLLLLIGTVCILVWSHRKGTHLHACICAVTHGYSILPNRNVLK